jgi:hypothetical protein
LSHQRGYRLGVGRPAGKEIIQGRNNAEQTSQEKRNAGSDKDNKDTLLASLKIFDLWGIGQVQSHFSQMCCGIKRQSSGWKIRHRKVLRISGFCNAVYCDCLGSSAGISLRSRRVMSAAATTTRETNVVEQFFGWRQQGPAHSLTPPVFCAKLVFCLVPDNLASDL